MAEATAASSLLYKKTKFDSPRYQHYLREYRLARAQGAFSSKLVIVYLSCSAQAKPYNDHLKTSLMVTTYHYF